MNHAILKLDKSRAYLLVKHSSYDYVNTLDSEGNPTGNWKVEVIGEEETWYDTHSSFLEEGGVKVGDSFLGGKITKTSTYDDYVKKFKDISPKFDEVNDSTEDRGFIRKTGHNKYRFRDFDFWYKPEVQYAQNPNKYVMTMLMQTDIN